MVQRGPVSRILCHRRASCQARHSLGRPPGARTMVAIITLGRWSPNASSGQPEGDSETGHLSPPIWPCSGRGLPGQPVTRTAGGLLPHHFTLTRTRHGCGAIGRPCCQRGSGRYVSVALSVGFPLPGVTRRPALWSSDFPHLAKARRDRPAPLDHL